MYLIEALAKLWIEYKKKKNKVVSKNNENEEHCEHFFLPLDSTADYLACNKCGFVVKNKIRDNNFFLRR